MQANDIYSNIKVQWIAFRTTRQPHENTWIKLIWNTRKINHNNVLFPTKTHTHNVDILTKQYKPSTECMVHSCPLSFGLHPSTKYQTSVDISRSLPCFGMCCWLEYANKFAPMAPYILSTFQQENYSIKLHVLQFCRTLTNNCKILTSQLTSIKCVAVFENESILHCAFASSYFFCNLLSVLTSSFSPPPRFVYCAWTLKIFSAWLIHDFTYILNRAIA